MCRRPARPRRVRTSPLGRHGHPECGAARDPPPTARRRDERATLEIYQYDPSLDHPPTEANRPGFGHLAFQVPEVEAARGIILAEGGGTVGDVVTTETADGRHVTWTYITDPEGNIVELQSWS